MVSRPQEDLVRHVDDHTPRQRRRRLGGMYTDMVRNVNQPRYDILPATVEDADSDLTTDEENPGTSVINIPETDDDAQMNEEVTVLVPSTPENDSTGTSTRYERYVKQFHFILIYFI